MEEEIPKFKEKLLQLPKSGGFYGFSDDRGILYFFDFIDTKPITKFHKKEGHKTIPKSERTKCILQDSNCVRTAYTHGILLRIGFWTFYKGNIFRWNGYGHGEELNHGVGELNNSMNAFCYNFCIILFSI